jgi:hypothetical protein
VTQARASAQRSKLDAQPQERERSSEQPIQRAHLVPSQAHQEAATKQSTKMTLERAIT